MGLSLAAGEGYLACMKMFARTLRKVWILTAALWIAASSLVRAADAKFHFLRPGAPDPEMLAPPPLPGSPEQASDMGAVVAAVHSASSNEIAMAASEKKYDVFDFAPAVGAFFQADNLPKTAAFFKRVKSDASDATDAAQERWKRPKPFVVNPSLGGGGSESSYGYPSGHSAGATVLALVLADMCPGKRAEIEALGCGIGWRRVILARHYPTDIHAGRTYAIAIYNELKKSPKFQREYAEAKAEIDKAQSR
jgi:acid phosphatase (class A)